MDEITSLNNELVKTTAKLLQKKYRDETGLFLIEGQKACEEALSKGIALKHVFINKNNTALAEQYKNADIHIVDEKILHKLSDTKSAPPIIAVAGQLENNINKIPQKNSAILILENIKDAGNLGTIIRTACAFGMDGIVLCGESVDIYSPKVVRSSVGYLFSLPFYKAKSIDEIKKYFALHKFLATSLDKTLNPQVLENVDLRTPVAFMFGSEAEGLSDKLLQFADIYVTIPMEKAVESLNLSISTGVVLYEYSRQRYNR
ncbi:MAG: RNA methyltransferase [Candidatus Gastranaerophilales bacterium]|nr:RNA methyltransferase [Candidatus Gastranaerophilales bacterium]